MHHQSISLLLMFTAMDSIGVKAQQALGGNAGVRGYEDHPNTPTPTTFQTLTEPDTESQRGLSVIIAIVVGCVAVVALAIAMAYRYKNLDEPTTPRDDLVGVTTVSTKSVGTEYQRSFDRPTGKTPKLRTHEPHSPKMPPPPPLPHHTQPLSRQLLALRSPPQSPRSTNVSRTATRDGEDVAVVAL